ncbi:tRNA(Met) cytidine acetate ligase [Sporomusa carbonis]|uniref:nucleotidyltransferase n=1 Tax=Sporomusa carbonis TaxID=3076075 RepID=UPI003A6C26D1
MKSVGMIVEYNPFHNGHLHHLNKARRISGAQFTIGIMSGNFVQRGEPAIADKWSRAALAVKAGVDLILELPAVFTVRSAQYFATGGIQLLSRLGVVNYVCFGAETADLSVLTAAAKALATGNTIDSLRQNMKTGKTYAASLAMALHAEAEIDSAVIRKPNNILAIEYLRAIAAYAPHLVPLPIERCSANYHDTSITSTIASATAVRTAIIKDGLLIPDGKAYQSVPPVCAHQINKLISAGRAPVTLDAFSNIILAKLRTMRPSELADLPDVTEGLHNKISDAALKAATASELLSIIKSKRYTVTRLQRILVHALLGTTKTKLAHFDQTGPLYARILAFNQNGRLLLKAINKRSTVPIITKFSQHLTSKERYQENLPLLKDMLSYDVAATDVYVLGSPNCQWRIGGLDYQTSPLYIAD